MYIYTGYPIFWTTQLNIDKFRQSGDKKIKLPEESKLARRDDTAKHQKLPTLPAKNTATKILDDYMEGKIIRQIESRWDTTRHDYIRFERSKITFFFFYKRL